MMNATKDIPKRPVHCLPMDELNDGIKLCKQLIGIIDCVMVTSMNETEARSGSIPNACWAAMDVVEQLEGIINTRHPISGKA